MFVTNATISLDAHRKGFCYVEDIKGVSLKNFDMKASKALNGNLTVTFLFLVVSFFEV